MGPSNLKIGLLLSLSLHGAAFAVIGTAFGFRPSTGPSEVAWVDIQELPIQLDGGDTLTGTPTPNPIPAESAPPPPPVSVKSKSVVAKTERIRPTKVAERSESTSSSAPSVEAPITAQGTARDAGVSSDHTGANDGRRFPLTNSGREYVSNLSRLLARHQHYPFIARRRGIEGVVLAKLRVNQNGGLEDVVIERGSGAQILDDCAIKMIRDAAPFPELPVEITVPAVQFLVPIEFRLKG